MRHIFFWLLVLPIIIVLVTFTVMNRQDVTLDLWPLPWETPLPAYGLIFGCLLVGFLFGLLVMWRHGAPGRRRHRDLARQVNVQAGELNSLRQTATAAGPVKVGTGAGRDANILVPPAI
jgi:uncharacterized integral membrane protein